MRDCDPLQSLRGIGPKREALLSQLGLNTVEDLLYLFPTSYEDTRPRGRWSELQIGEKGMIALRVLRVRAPFRKGKLTIQTVDVEDMGGVAGEITFFNQFYATKSLYPGKEIFVKGTRKSHHRRATMASPEISAKPPTRDVTPKYGSMRGLKGSHIGNFLKAIDWGELTIEENLPRPIRETYHLIPRDEALFQMHAPVSEEALHQARTRLIFEEFFTMQLALCYAIERPPHREVPRYLRGEKMKRFFEYLPFPLTEGQERAWREILSDMESGASMNRLVQGDVGCGKTAVAAAALVLTVENHKQGVMMAPTEILARQHLASLEEFFQGLEIRTGLLVGSLTEKEKTRVKESFRNGDIDVLVGTHALLQDDVLGANIGLSITDEQHRFGVSQRRVLQEEKEPHHRLMMTATPIPRTLAISLYGDLDVSIIDTMPPGRTPTATYAIGPEQRERAFDLIQQELTRGHQAYVVAALVEENEESDITSAEELFRLCEERFPDAQVGLLHGKMPNSEKDVVMERFSEGEIQILVSTTVIEVGVNVPNATILLIHDAQQFGLAQLHQLRGRVGRGKAPGMCILLNTSQTDISWQRMKILEESTDGFWIAEKDLELRGFGDFFGTAQHGFFDFRLGNPMRDHEIFRAAQKEAQRFYERYPFDVLPEGALRRALQGRICQMES